MKRIFIVCVLMLVPGLSQAELRVLACEPEWASLAQELGGDLVETTSATQGLQDPHYIQARPSLIARVRSADLLVCSGAQLEIGWLPKLLQKGNNPGVQPGSPGYLEASAYVKRLEVPASVDRAKGDMHPQGNPHVQADARNFIPIAEALSARLQQLDPANAETYRQNTEVFLDRWRAAIVEWEANAAPLRGSRVIPHHKSWVYLENWLGLVEVATLEPVPGVPPTASHLGELLAQLGTEGQGADAIIRAPYQSDKPSEWLSERTGIPDVLLPLTVGGTPEATDLFSLFDDIIGRLLVVTGQGT
jgi:zinc/manganese transport system substrate-binding protein